MLVPERPIFVDLGLALLALGLVALTARDTRERVWGAPFLSAADRVRHSTRHLLIGTAAVALLFAAWRIALGGQLLKPTLFAALVAFVPWALLQQALFQFYLLGRVRALLPGSPRLVVASVNGLFFGAVHLPAWDLTLVTIVAGSVWSWYYLRDRSLLPIALSHAVLGATYFYWVHGQDLVQRWLGAL
ncbi:MAG TPA: CPBP family intramembrane glutamic endopeptidase [Methylomirabilota bacterium]|nr:CPBP family intramembrane glutamic endopeptidase [Methylomirabilota bacterium]